MSSVLSLMSMHTLCPKYGLWIQIEANICGSHISLLDHVYVSHKDNVSTSGTLPISISDNLPVFVNWTTRSNFSNSNEHKYIGLPITKGKYIYYAEGGGGGGMKMS
jgi:hypothetical protein